MKSRALLVLVLASFALPQGLLAQGSLTPPGPPAPTMKSLDQVEARIIVNATNTPGTASAVFRISAPGSYYLTGNVAGVSGKAGIEIASSNVTLDLNGFSLRGVSGSTAGIRTPDVDFDNIVIRNGFIVGFGGNGIDLLGDGMPNGTLIEKVHSSYNGGHGFFIATAVVRDCTAVFNAGEGIRVFLAGCVVVDCLAGFNGGFGISALQATVVGCVAQNNTGGGISASEGTVVKSCAAYLNGADGIVADDGASVSECVARKNSANGIRVFSDCRIVGNACSGNFGGINATGQNNLLEGNHLIQNTVGLDVDSPNNIIRGNTVRLHSDNYAIVAGNQVEILLSQIPETIDVTAKVVLAGDLTGGGSSGILITVDNVTIDLAGHALIGAGGGDGIFVSGARSNISVRNGTIRNWSSDGIDAASANGGHFADLILHNNTTTGLKTGTRAQVRHVISRSNGTGILTGTNSVVADCTSDGNTSFGISVSTACTVERCVASTNGAAGIQVVTGCTVVGNLCDLQGSAAGIRVIGNRNRIEGNNCSRNAVGVEVLTTGNTIIRNSALGSTSLAYSIVGGNDVGPISAASAATNPFANIAF